MGHRSRLLRDARQARRRGRPTSPWLGGTNRIIVTATNANGVVSARRVRRHRQRVRVLPVGRRDGRVLRPRHPHRQSDDDRGRRRDLVPQAGRDDRAADVHAGARSHDARSRSIRSSASRTRPCRRSSAPPTPCRSSSSARCSGTARITAATPAMRSTRRHAVAVRRGQPGLLRHVRAAGQCQRDGGDGDGDVPRGRRRPTWCRWCRVRTDLAGERLRRHDSATDRQVLLDRGHVDAADHRRARDVLRHSGSSRAATNRLACRRPRPGGSTPRARPARTSTRTSSSAIPNPTRGQPDGHVPQGRRHDAGAQQAGAGQRPLHDARGRRGPVAGRHGGVDDGGVRHPGGVGASHVLAGRCEHLVRGAQQLRRHDHGDASGRWRRDGSVRSRNSRPTC